MSYDLIIIGGGIAGLSTAVRSIEQGLKPLVLEKGDEPNYPCNARYSGGVVHVAEKEMRAPQADILAKINHLTNGTGSSGLASIMAEDAEQALEWLRNNGAKFVKGGVLEFMRWVMAPPRPRRPGLDWKGRGPDVLLRNLTTSIESGGGTFKRGVRGRALIVENGRVVGITAKCGGETIEYHATAVVICDGGFQGDPDLVRKYISPKPEALFTRGAGTGCGDGLRMAETVGAKLIGTDRFYGHLLGREVFQNEKLWPYPTVDAITRSSILIDQSGNRLFDEGKGGIFLANEIAKLDDPLSIKVIFDDALWTGLAADNRYPPCMNPAFVNEGGTVYAEDSLVDLGDQVGVPCDTLIATVEAYNQAIDAGTCGNLSPIRSTDVVTPQPIRTPPFHAIELCVGITYTMGGIAIDKESRVLNADERPIEGLYAAGSTTGGIEGGPNAAYLGGLSKGVITGLRAADSVAAAKS
jgi:fumarate reductase flavoprotein subunit